MNLNYSYLFHIFILILYSTESLSQPNIPSGRHDIPFNVDLDFPVRISNEANRIFDPQRAPEDGSMFGASLTADDNIIYVGAPKLNSEDLRTSTGAAFRCASDLTKNEQIVCKEINFVQSLLTRETGKNYTPRNHSMIGHSMVITGETVKHITICAPTWVTNSHPTRSDPDLSSEGTCFQQRITRPADLPRPIYYIPQKRVSGNRPYESHTMFGFSMIPGPESGQLLIGIPGFADFAGTFVLHSGDMRTWRSRNFTHSDSYGGSALALFRYRNRNRFIAMGIPRPSKFTGEVVFVDPDNALTEPIGQIFSQMEESGDYFGSVLTANTNTMTDQVDLYVGAPLHSTRARRQSGRVYVYKNIAEKLSMGQQTFDSPIVLQPKRRRALAQYGSAIAMIDLNRDGFSDVVISAPYEDTLEPGSEGALYFYHYEHNALNPASEIRVEPSNFKQQLKGFGYSLWTESDFDKNGVNDLLIGSSISEDVTILRTKKVIVLSATLEFDRKGINLTDSRGCNNRHSCFRVKYCIRTDRKTNFEQDVTYQVNVTVSDRKLRVKESRVMQPRQSFFVTQRRPNFCGTEMLYIEMKSQEDVYDIITPIEMEISVAVQNPPTDKFCRFCPVARPAVAYREINFEHGCQGKKCLSHLNLAAELRYGPKKAPTTVVQGIYPNLELVVTVKNDGESSIDTVVYIETNAPGLMLRGESRDSRCKSSPDANIFRCDVNRFLLQGTREEFKVLFDFSYLQSPEVTFNLRLESQSDVAPGSVVKVSQKTQVVKEAQFKLLGGAQYNYSFSTQSPDVSFPISLNVDKTGHSMVNSSVVAFLLPYDIVDIDPISKYRCYHLDSSSTSITDRMFHNGTLILPCEERPEVCRRFECTVAAFKPGSQTEPLDISLVFHSGEIPSKIRFQEVVFAIKFEFYARDPLIDGKQMFASLESKVLFEKQATAPNPKSNPLIMIGGGSVGLIIILVTVYVLFKAGFFKRKKREEMMKAKARMSMAPNALANFDHRNGS